MLQKGFLKPEISIKNIGKLKFYSGILYGCLFALIISFFFNYSRESLRVISFLGDPLLFDERIHRLYDLFFAAISTSLGFGITTIYWLKGSNRKIKKQYLKNFLITNSAFVLLVCLMAIARLGSLFSIIVYGMRGYDDDLNLITDFEVVFLTIPIYAFLIHWNSIQLLFKIKYWLLKSCVIYAIITAILVLVSSTNRGILNETYYFKNKVQFSYIQSEFENAKKLGIVFPNTLQLTLQKRYTAEIHNLVYDLKNSFNRNYKVSLDTLILEKIVVHNVNHHGKSYFRRIENRDLNWPFARPLHIYNQILLHDSNSIETQQLFEILSLQAKIFNMPSFWDNAMVDKYSPYEYELISFRGDIMFSTTSIQSELIQVIEKLKSTEKYSKYHHLLTTVEFDDRGYSQKYIELNL